MNIGMHVNLIIAMGLASCAVCDAVETSTSYGCSYCDTETTCSSKSGCSWDGSYCRSIGCVGSDDWSNDQYRCNYCEEAECTSDIGCDYHSYDDDDGYCYEDSSVGVGCSYVRAEIDTCQMGDCLNSEICEYTWEEVEGFDYQEITGYKCETCPTGKMAWTGGDRDICVTDILDQCQIGGCATNEICTEQYNYNVYEYGYKCEACPPGEVRVVEDRISDVYVNGRERCEMEACLDTYNRFNDAQILLNEDIIKALTFDDDDDTQEFTCSEVDSCCNFLSTWMDAAPDYYSCYAENVDVTTGFDDDIVYGAANNDAELRQLIYDNQVENWEFLFETCKSTSVYYSGCSFCKSSGSFVTISIITVVGSLVATVLF